MNVHNVPDSPDSLSGKNVLLIIGGGIAAYKCLDLIRRLRERGAILRVVMTSAATQFVTPLSVSALTGEPAHQQLFDPAEEHQIGHIRLAREPDIIVVAPATADLIAKMAHGLANDLASTVLLATTAPVLVAPAMNPKMWQHKATQRNVAQLETDDINFCGPEYGEMAESGESGLGRMSRVENIVDAINNMLAGRRCADDGPLDDRHVLVTAGPTHEPIDPIRYLANRSSGKQGYAIAAAAARSGARVTLVSGPTGLADPDGVSVVRVETAAEMLGAVNDALPAEIAIFTAAVADWRVAQPASKKIKKAGTGTGKSKSGSSTTASQASGAPTLELVENPDILKAIASKKTGRPALVIGFAAETNDIINHAKAKLAAKGCDWIVANDVSSDSAGSANGPGGVMGGDYNKVHLITADGSESWPQLSKAEVAQRLIDEAAAQICVSTKTTAAMKKEVTK